MLRGIYIGIRYLSYASLIAIIFTPAAGPALLIFIASFAAHYFFGILSLPLSFVAPVAKAALEEGRNGTFQFWKALANFWSSVVVAGSWMSATTYFLWSKTNPDQIDTNYLIIGFASASLSSMAVFRAMKMDSVIPNPDAPLGMLSTWLFFICARFWDPSVIILIFGVAMLASATFQSLLLAYELRKEPVKADNIPEK